MLTVNVKDFGAESITEGTVMEWKAQIGQMVKKGEVIAAIETDKVTVDVVAEQDGVLAEILVKAVAAVDGFLTEVFVKVDETAVAGEKLCIITPGVAPAGGDAPAATTPAPTPTPAPEPSKPTPAAASSPPTAAPAEGGR